MSRPNYGHKDFARKYRKAFQRKRRHPLILDAFLAIIILSFITFIVSHIQQPSLSTNEWSGIASVIDGDTITLQHQRLRLKGIDAPEIDQSCQIQGQKQACGIIARQALQQKIAHQTIACTSTARDKYRRFLANCRLGSINLNQWLVKEGYAVSYYDYPSQESDARLNKRGIWAGDFERPQEWRKRRNAHLQKNFDDNNASLEKYIRLIKQAYNRLFNGGETDK